VSRGRIGRSSAGRTVKARRRGPLNPSTSRSLASVDAARLAIFGIVRRLDRTRSLKEAQILIEQRRRLSSSSGLRPRSSRDRRPPAPVTVVVPGFSPAARGPASSPPEMTPARTDEVAQRAGSGHSPRRAVRPRPKGSRSVSLGREPRPSPEAPRGRPASPRTPARGATRRPGPCWRTCPRRSPPR